MNRYGYIQMQVFLLLFPLMGMTGKAMAQAISFSPQQADSILNPNLMKDAEQILRFDKTVLNIGTLTEDDAPRSYRFTCTNVTGKPLTIDRVNTTCGCAVAEFGKRVIHPDETRTVVLTYHPRDHVGTVDANAFVYLSISGKKPVARLTLTGNVLPGADVWRGYPYAMGKLRLKQKSMTFKEAEQGKHPSERILCANSGDKPLRLSAFALPKYASFHTEPEVIAPGGEADLVITLKPELIPDAKGNSFTFPVLLRGISGKPSDNTFIVTVTQTKKK